MDLRYSAQDEAFRAELRSWLTTATAEIGVRPTNEDWTERRNYDERWQRMLFEAGYAGINWPTEYGGRGASLTEQLVYYEEIARSGAPDVGIGFVGQLHAGPTIMMMGSEAQRQAHLPRILDGTEVWCQGFSEPGAGSDLAALQCKAVRDGDEYVITGQKIWTSFAQVADYCEMLVRTDPEAPKHKGITWLIVPMDLPGIDVRPLRNVSDTTEFSEVFFDEVRVPVENRVGDENAGWRVAMTTLSFERGTAFMADQILIGRLVEDMAALARRVSKAGSTCWDDVEIRRELGHLAAEVDALDALTKRNVSAIARAGDGIPDMNLAVVVKLAYSELRQRLGRLGMKIIDRAGLVYEDMSVDGHGLATRALLYERLHSLALSIAAGTSQVQKNIIAERVMGLPKEPTWTSN